MGGEIWHLLKVRPVTYRAACAFIEQQHRHHGKPQGWLFGASLENDGQLCGVVCVGRPVARRLQDGLSCEVTRLCTDGTRNACSMLYGAAARAAKALGYRRIITYTLADEPGVSLRAAGWQLDGLTDGGPWDRPGRPRNDKAPIGVKQRWVLAFA